MRCAPPYAAKKAGKHTATEFNEQVSVDLLFATGSGEGQYTVFSVVDAASRYHMAVTVPDKKPGTIAKAFASYWMRWAGAPRKIVHDQGGEFNGQFERLIESINAATEVTGTDAAWQNSLAERHGGVLKVMLARILEDTAAYGEDEFEMALVAAITAKNQLASIHGFSPAQHVLGQNVRLPAGVFG